VSPAWLHAGSTDFHQPRANPQAQGCDVNPSRPRNLEMPILQLNDVSKSFGALKVADAVTFDLSEGEALGIIGPNGAGKSTMFNLIAGNLVADTGTIRFSGNDITRTPPMVRCTAGIGRTFQIPQPFEKLTVFENLLVAAAFGSRKREAEVGNRCADILVETGLADRANQPAGSLGLLQRKRLELARALATDPKILLLDEIAGGLTEAECHALVETIRGVHRSGMSIIWIEHVLHALNAVVERLLVLNFGKVIGIGEPQAIMASREVREIYLGIEI
jgi:branched-chain amino acid transport system ATP-binding protein